MLATDQEGWIALENGVQVYECFVGSVWKYTIRLTVLSIQIGEVAGHFRSP